MLSVVNPDIAEKSAKYVSSFNTGIINMHSSYMQNTTLTYFKRLKDIFPTSAARKYIFLQQLHEVKGKVHNFFMPEPHS